MGGKSHKGVVERIIKIKKMAQNISPEDSAISLLIKSKASHIFFLKNSIPKVKVGGILMWDLVLL